MVDQPSRSLQDLVRHVGRFSEDAFLFVRDALTYTADRVHGPETDAHRLIQQYMAANDWEPSDLIARYHAGELPQPVVEAMDSLGGSEKLNRHVSGRDLCWGLRDFALERWGLLARVVLESWRVRSTEDFGRIVFGFIEFDLMRKQPEDALEDFKDVFNFPEAFDQLYRIGQTDRVADAENGDAESAD